MGLKASEIHSKTACSLSKPDYNELTNFMDGCYTNKESYEIKKILNDMIANLKKTIASTTIRNIDIKT